MKINLTGGELARYREIKRDKMRFSMPDKRVPTGGQKNRESRLTPRQRKKAEEMEKEG